MAVQIVVPELGESVLDATVGEWRKKEGERVEAGEALVELETDKVNLEVSAPQSGVLVKIEHPSGDDVKVGDALGSIDPSGSPAAGGEEKAPAPEVEKQQTPEPAKAGVPTEQGAASKQGATPEKPEAPPQGGAAPELTPVARRFAEEKGIDVSQVRGSGPAGRVTKADLEAFETTADRGPATGDTTVDRGPQTAQNTGDGGPTTADGGPQATPAAASTIAGQRPQTTPAGAATTDVQRPQNAAMTAPAGDGRTEERVRMSRRRRTIAQRLVEAQQTAAMLTTFNEIDMTAVMELRKRRGEEFQKRYEVKLGFMSFFVKASLAALKAFPEVNAEIQGDEIVLKHYYDIGIAIGAEEGLVVPVLKDADRMTFAGIEQKIGDYVERTKAGTLTLDDLRGGTFTITNGGVFGSLMSTPILMPPQVAILGMHKIEKRPVAINDEVVIRPMMYVALSYDHRIVDGKEAVQFLVRVKELIEDPESMLLEG